MPLTDLSGKQILQYTLQAQLRERPSSALYLAQNTKTGQPVYLELLYADTENNPEKSGRFQRRMETVSQLQHPAIAPIEEVGNTVDHQAYAIIAYTPATTLAEKLADDTYKPTPKAALHLIEQLAEALAVAHPAGIFHHDLRPENIILRDDGSVQLIDLGVPITNCARTPEQLNAMTTLDYASPEQLDGKPLSGRSNIYSLGVILYQLLAGHPPRLPRSEWDIFNRSQLPQEVPLEEVCPGLTNETYKVVQRCLWRPEWSRYPTIADFLTAIKQAITAEETAETAPPPRKFPLTRQQLIIGGSGLLVILVVILVLLVVLR